MARDGGGDGGGGSVVEDCWFPGTWFTVSVSDDGEVVVGDGIGEGLGSGRVISPTGIG